MKLPKGFSLDALCCRNAGISCRCRYVWRGYEGRDFCTGVKILFYIKFVLYQVMYPTWALQFCNCHVDGFYVRGSFSSSPAYVSAVHVALYHLADVHISVTNLVMFCKLATMLS